VCSHYRKRPRRDEDADTEDITVKTEPLIPGLDLVDESGNVDVKEEDILDTGAVPLQHSSGFTYCLVMNESFR